MADFNLFPTPTPMPKKDSGTGTVITPIAKEYVKGFVKSGGRIYTTLRSNPFEYTTLRFPLHIGDDDGLRDYILININQNSSFAEPQLGSENENINAGQQAPSDKTAREQYAANQRIKAGTVGDKVKSKGGNKNIVVQGEIGRAATQEDFSNPNRKRLKTAIVLPLPTSAVSASYAADWQATALGAAGGTLDRFNAAAAAMKQDASQIGSIASAAIGDKSKFSAIIGYSAAPEELKNALEKNAGFALNPRTEVVYKGTPNRTFQFEFKLSPRNQEEGKALERIIQTLKYAQAPSLTGEFGSWLRYPDDFDIGIYYNGELNPHVSKISSCAMTAFNVDYSGGQGGMPTFHDGRPQTIILTMQFTELEMITKERVGEGY